MEPPTVVIDNGTGYSKMGYAGNLDPSYIIPSTIATSLNKVNILLILSSFHTFLSFRNQNQVRLRTPISISISVTKLLQSQRHIS